MTDAEAADALRAAVDAVLAKLAAEDAAIDAIQARDRAWKILRDNNWPNTKIEDEMRRELVARGIPEQLTRQRGFGISHDRVRQVVGGRRKRM